MGVDADATYAVYQIPLRQFDRVVWYTDGLIEATRDLDEGERRLDAALLKELPSPDAIVDDVIAGEQRDDIALLILTVEEDMSRRHYDGTRWRFETESAAAAQQARPSFTSYLRDRGLDEDELFVAETVFGELVGNVVRHAPGPIEIEIIWSGNEPTLVVRDRGPGFVPPPVSELPDLFAESGRGIYMVRMYAGEPAVRMRLGGGADIRVAFRRRGEVAPL